MLNMLIMIMTIMIIMIILIIIPMIIIHNKLPPRPGVSTSPSASRSPGWTRP